MTEEIVQSISFYLQGHSVLAPVIYILLRPLAIIIPPIPGTPFELVSLLLFGPILGFIYSEIGIMLGGMGAFYIARYFREPMVARFTSLQKVHKAEDTLSERKKFWGLVVLRILTVSVFDYISFAAGLTRMKPRTYFWSSFLGQLPYVILFFYLGDQFLRTNIYYLFGFVVVLFLVSFLLSRTALVKNLLK